MQIVNLSDRQCHPAQYGIQRGWRGLDRADHFGLPTAVSGIGFNRRKLRTVIGQRQNNLALPFTNCQIQREPHQPEAGVLQGQPCGSQTLKGITQHNITCPPVQVGPCGRFGYQFEQHVTQGCGQHHIGAGWCTARLRGFDKVADGLHFDDRGTHLSVKADQSDSFAAPFKPRVKIFSRQAIDNTVQRHELFANTGDRERQSKRLVRSTRHCHTQRPRRCQRHVTDGRFLPDRHTRKN